ncbi:MerR family transcriptional regulator [Cryobacterium suzukii]|uniref:MerR family transcriptional regulator n=1 Tax=Cryobacterium suzukii TaxID=1259198 RepID=A0A4R9AH42_9MICO|nr:MerR family transcriptional regulator [Cryobacterium suzukii]
MKASARTDGGFRLYSPDDFTRLMLIRGMKTLGFTNSAWPMNSSHSSARSSKRIHR